MRTQVIATDRPVEARPVEDHPELKRVKSKRFKGKNVTHKDMLDMMRTTRFAREVHSSFFLSTGGVGESAYSCKCGFEGMFKASKCARCGAKV